MPQITAQILIGRSSTQKGILASHSMVLLEDEQPVWFLQETGAQETGLNGSCVTWIPRRESILADGLLMIAVFAVQSKDLNELASHYIHGAGSDKADLNHDVKPDHLEELSDKCRNLNFGRKLAITVFEGSSISKELPILEQYRVPVEVCTTQYARRSQDQGYDYTVTGSLQQNPVPLQWQH
jgi:hypothetical protein